MNTAQLLALFDRINDAPDAIPRLRHFILDLAVRGKLVEQDPNEEPSSLLLNRIRAEKARVLKGGSIRPEKPVPSIPEGGLPFPIPVNWGWSQLAEVGFLNPRNSADDGLLASFVPMPLISAEYGVPNSHQLRPWAEMKSGYTHFAEGDVALAKITPCFENGKSTVFRGLAGGIGAGTTELHVVRPIIAVAEYVLIFLKSPYFIASGIPKMTGTAGQKRVPTDYFAHSPFPFPPLAEQHRIVAKVDELMSLCDRLEEAQSERERRRDRLAAVSLHRLSEPADTDAPEVFREHVRFYLDHLPRLTTRPDQIKQIRQTILNLSIRGQLVPQCAKDISLIENISIASKKRNSLIASGGLRKIEEVPPANDIEPFRLPYNWLWAFPDQLSALSAHALTIGPFGSNLVTSDYTTGGTPLVFVGDIRAEFSRPPRHFVSGQKAEDLKGHSTGPGDLLITKMGDPPGDTAIYPDSRPRAIITADCIKWTLHTSLALTRYVYLALRAPLVAHQIAEITKGAAHQKVSLKRFRGILIPLPPLAEQRRIVAKVDELMSVCDQLEAQLTTAQTESRLLLEAVLHEALVPAAQTL